MANHLIDEKSPYLLQHAQNPVNWFPWGEQALALAKKTNKPIFVSIGYATCHWCHVMEHESFEDLDTAELLNQHFVAIKVDREERPDLDSLFMSALHALGFQGGWPLNCFCTPEGKPFFGGTYFPKEARYGRISFPELLQKISQDWADEPADLANQAQQITEWIKGQQEQGDPEEVVYAQISKRAFNAYQQSYDKVYGGFTNGSNNKFPASMGLEWLMTPAPVARGSMPLVSGTLDAMLQGGITDQLGGGIYRYSTDRQWLIPHFEKMLYDNSLHLNTLTLAFQQTREACYQEAALATAGYLLRDLSDPEGGFYCGEDADSEGEEGRFYLWDKSQVAGVLNSQADVELALAHWGINDLGNYENRNHLFVASTQADLADRFGLTQAQVSTQLGQIRQELQETRSKRVRPLRDEKMLCSWNSLAIIGLAKAGVVFQNSPLLGRAVQAGEFVWERFFDDQGRLFRRFKEGERKVPGFLCDYAQLGLACLALFEATGEASWVSKAIHLAQEITRLFGDESGGFWDVGSDQEAHVSRGRDLYDGVEPSGSSAAIRLFAQLAALGRPEFGDQARSALKRVGSNVTQGSSYLLSGWAELEEPRSLVLCGDNDQRWLQKAGQLAPVGLRLVWVKPGDEAALARLLPVVLGKPAAEQPTAYWCEGQTCLKPIHQLAELEKKLTAARLPSGA